MSFLTSINLVSLRVLCNFKFRKIGYDPVLEVAQYRYAHHMFTIKISEELFFLFSHHKTFGFISSLSISFIGNVLQNTGRSESKILETNYKLSNFKIDNKHGRNNNYIMKILSSVGYLSANSLG